MTTPDLAGLCERLKRLARSPVGRVDAVYGPHSINQGWDEFGRDMSEAAAAIESLVAENERMRALSERKLVLMKTTVRRLRRLGRPHADLDEAIANTRTALEGASDDR